MRRGLSLAIGATLLLGVSPPEAVPGADGVDTSPWHVQNVSKGNQARGTAETTAPATDPSKYLHIRLGLKVAPDAQKMHKFRVTDARGQTVGELWGWNKDHTLVVFEGKWSGLEGLYLDGLGHREPLFKTAPVVVEPRPPVMVRQPEVVPQPVLPGRVVVDDRRPDRVIVDGRRPDRAVVEGRLPDRVIMREGGPDRVVIDDRRGDAVIRRDGGLVVHRGGTRVVGGPDAVVVRGGPRALFVDATG